MSDDSTEFFKSKRFKGAKQGFVFKLGKKGLGYYRDGSGSKSSALKLKSKIKKKAKSVKQAAPIEENGSSSSINDSSTKVTKDSGDLQRSDGEEGEEESKEVEKVSFESLGVVPTICEACSSLKWHNPTAIQKEAIPYALQDRDIIALAETGSGKTGAFSIPMLQKLLDKPQRLFACVLAPTRELAFQIYEVVNALGASIGIKCACIVGGIDMMSQAIALARKPHVIVATPGRLIDHLENTKGFNLRQLQLLILDEADRMLSMDFEEEINKLLQVIPRQRNTYLFSATMTQKVAKLQRASLRDPVKVQVSHRYQTVKTLNQQYLFIPAKYKDCYLTYVLNELNGQTCLIFTSTCSNAQKTTLMLRNLGLDSICLHGQMPQSKRLGALNKFKSGSKNILVATDVASRGLDIPAVDLVVNYDVPANGKDYIHRVGRTARAGRSGRAVTLVSQYDVEVYQRIEHMLGKKLTEFPTEKEVVLVLLERVCEAQRHAALEMRDSAELTGNKRGSRGDDDEVEQLMQMGKGTKGGGKKNKFRSNKRRKH